MLLLAVTCLVGTAAPAAAAGIQAEVVTYGDRTQPVVGLSFDAGSDAGNAGTILDILHARGIRASFGVTGRWAEQNPDLVRRMVREGHHLINHTYDHQSFTGRSTSTPALTRAQRFAELDRTEQIVHDLTGTSTRPWFRPPYGDFDTSVAEDAQADGYGSVAMWTIDSLGWNGLPAADIVTRVLGRIEPGALLLMHVGAASQDATALPAVLDGIAARGLRAVAVPDMLRWRPFDNARAFVAQQYVDLLGRTADAAGLEAWRANLLAGRQWPADVVVAITGSGEYVAVVPPLVRLYLAAFARVPDIGGLRYWTARVRSGASLDWVAAAFAASPELTTLTAGLDDEGFVRLLYRHVLGREPDPGGLAFWTTALAIRRIDRSQVLLGFSDASEFRTSSAPRVLAVGSYAALLGRQVDPGGDAYWTSQLANGLPARTFVSALLGSAEYAARIG